MTKRWTLQVLLAFILFPLLTACTDAKIKTFFKNLSKMNQKPYLHLTKYSPNAITRNRCYEIEVGSFDKNGVLLVTSSTVPFTVEPGSSHLLYSDASCGTSIGGGPPYSASILSGSSFSSTVYFKPTTLGVHNLRIATADPTYNSETLVSYTVGEPIIKIHGLPTQMYPNSCYQFVVAFFEADGMRTMQVPVANQVDFRIDTAGLGQFFSNADCSSSVDLTSTTRNIPASTEMSIAYYYKTPGAFTNINFDLVWQATSSLTALAEDLLATKELTGSSVAQKAIPSFPAGSSASVGACFPIKLLLVNKDSIPVSAKTEIAVSLKSSGIVGNFYNTGACASGDIIDSTMLNQGSTSRYIYFKALQATSGSGTISANINVMSTTEASASIDVVRSIFPNEPWMNLIGWPNWKKGSYLGSHELPATLQIETDGTFTCQEWSSGWVGCSNLSANLLTIDMTNWNKQFKITVTKNGIMREFPFVFAEVYQRNGNSNSFWIFQCNQTIASNITEGSLLTNGVNCFDGPYTLTVTNPLNFNSSSSFSGIIGRSDSFASVMINFASSDSIKFQPTVSSYNVFSNLNVYSNSTNPLANHIYVNSPSNSSSFFFSDLQIISNQDTRSAFEAYDIAGAVILNRVEIQKGSSSSFSSSAIGIYGVNDARIHDVKIDSINASSGFGDGFVFDNISGRGVNIQEFSKIEYIGDCTGLAISKTYSPSNQIFNSQFLDFRNTSGSTSELIYGGLGYYSSVGFYSSLFMNLGGASTVNYNGDFPGFISSLFFISSQTAPVIQKISGSDTLTLRGNHFYKNSGSSDAIALDGTGTGYGGASTYGATTNLYCKGAAATGSWGEFLTMGSYPTLISSGFFNITTTSNSEGFCEAANP